MALRQWGMGVVKTGGKKSIKHSAFCRSVFAVSPCCSSVGIVHCCFFKYFTAFQNCFESLGFRFLK